MQARMAGSPEHFWQCVRDAVHFYETRISPKRWGNEWGGLLSRRLGVVTALSYVPHISPAAEYGWCIKGGLTALSTWVIFDILLSNTSIAFITRDPIDPLRSVFLSLVSFASIAVGFSVLYGISKEGIGTNWPRTIYFSFVTITTLGYGDITPKADAIAIPLLIIAELLVGLYYLSVVLVTYSSWLQGRPQNNLSDPR